MRYLVLFSLIVLLSTSCTKKASTVDSNLKIKMEERLDSTGPGRKFLLHCETSKIYSCSNYSIANKFTKTGHSVVIEFTDIIKPEICLTSTGPATAEIDLGTLAEGTYELSINNGGDHCKGALVVSADAYKAELSGSSVVFEYNPLYRVPAETIWGTVGYMNTSQNAIVNSFLDSLAVYGAQTFTGPGGNYFYYQLDGSGNVARGNDGYYEAKYFIYKYSGNANNLQQLVRNFGNRYNDSLWIQVNNDQGRRYLSWMH